MGTPNSAERKHTGVEWVWEVILITITRIKSGEYHDSVTLLGVAQALSSAEGIVDAAVVMGTPANKGLLSSANLLTEQAQEASPNDLVIAVTGESEEAAQAALGLADRFLSAKPPASGDAGAQPNPRTYTAAVQQLETSNIALISVAGRYAAAVADEALTNNHHVFLFSDNVSLKDEIRLKKRARGQNLFVMGPDAGTSIINGVALGFANHVISGRVGIVAASGTGLQSVSSELSNQGVGISQAIGVGGRDLSTDVGGIMMMQGYQALIDDPETDVIVLISKPPSPKVVKKLLKRVGASRKPTVVCFLGGNVGSILATGAVPALTLEEAALFAAASANGKKIDSVLKKLEKHRKKLKRKAQEYKSSLNPKQKYYKGLFSGGTFCYETQLILGEMLGIKKIRSNAPIHSEQKQPGLDLNKAHTAIDYGADEFTVGRLHPMLDPDLRNRSLLQQALDPQTAVIYIDIVLGYGVHPDPAGAVLPAIQQAREELAQLGREIIFTASVCGTPNDPQNAPDQVEKLKNAGVVVLRSNASAAYFAGYLLS